MQYLKLKKYIEEYDVLKSKGMRKEANSILQEICLWIESLSSDDVDELLGQFITDICDTETFAFLLRRGDGQLPYPLRKPIRSWLLPRCQQERMPELRWFYQLYRNDFDHVGYAYSCLDTAYARAADDEKTQELLFERNVRALEYGVHELPVGLLITDEEAQQIFRECGAILQNGCAPMNMIQRYTALKQEYEAYLHSQSAAQGG